MSGRRPDADRRRHSAAETAQRIPVLLTYGEWIRVFVGAGLVIRDLIEIRPPEGATSTYRDAAETEWARHWPMEQIWVVDRVVR